MFIWINIIMLFIAYSILIALFASKAIRYKKILEANNIKVVKAQEEKIKKFDIYKLIKNTVILIYDLSVALSVFLIMLIVILFYLESKYFDGDWVDMAVFYLLLIAGFGTYFKLKLNAFTKYIKSNKEG